MNDDPLDHMRSPIEQCHRLADMITDQEGGADPSRMAADGEEDLKRLETERANR